MRLETNERLLVWRRRLGLNQRKMARKLGLTLKQYADVEEGNVPAHVVIPDLLIRHGDELRVGGMTDGEKCFLRRRREGKTQADVARDLKCCRRWVMLMETDRAPTDLLVGYWTL